MPQTSLTLLRYKEDIDIAELDIVAAKEKEEVDVRILRSAKVYHGKNSKIYILNIY